MANKVKHWVQVHPSSVLWPLGLALALMNASFLAKGAVPVAVAYFPLMTASYLIWILLMLRICLCSCDCSAEPPSLQELKKAARIPFFLMLCCLVLLMASCFSGQKLTIISMTGMQIAFGLSMVIAAFSISRKRRS